MDGCLDKNGVKPARKLNVEGRSNRGPLESLSVNVTYL